jgi:hypothetical protein
MDSPENSHNVNVLETWKGQISKRKLSLRTILNNDTPSGVSKWQKV